MLQLLSKPLHLTQTFVDSIGMYRVVSGTLSVLAAISIVLGFLGFMPYSGLSQIFSLALALLVALLLNVLISLILRIPANHESAVITALILFFLTIPEENIFALWPLVAAVSVAMVSKYVIAYRKQHFLNPAALGAAVISAAGLYTFSWWIANPVMFVPLLICGVLVVMKVRKWVPILALIGVGFIIYMAESLSYGAVWSEATRSFFVSWPTLFLAFYMLTEPFTMPAEKGQQFLYGGLVGFLSNTSMFSPVVSFTPELALVVANVIMWPARLRQKLFLHLEEKNVIAKDTYEFVFKKPHGFSFKAGQYLEWMLPHANPDAKGVRRYFTIASAPTEDRVRVAMKILDTRSSYKNALSELDITKSLIASQLAGDFLLPKAQTEKIGFIAGGIGITPFRSHIKYMLDTDTMRDTVLYYCVNTKDELAYQDIFTDASKSLLFQHIPVVSKESVELPCEAGYVTQDMLARRTPDYLERIWYISGPPGMVNAYKTLLRTAGVAASRIHTDFFPGAA